MTRWCRSAVLCGVLAVACSEPFVPRAGVPTLDDATTDSFTALSAGKEHTCALISTGSAYCWGSNEGGQLGVAESDNRCRRDDRLIPCEPLPVAVSGGMAFQKIAAGALHSCGLTADGGVYCWGDNLRGQLGDPGVRASFTPVRAMSNDRFTQVAAGGLHTCALRTDGAVLCWGANDDGQLGLSTVGNGSAVPATISTAQRFTMVVAGPRRTCASTADGAAYCWGAIWVSRTNGVDITRPEGTPTRVQQAPAIRALAVGAGTTCAISSDNDGFCWEANASGTLGDGSTTPSVGPVAISTSLDFVDVSVGASHSCAIATDARAYCWGSDNVGQLGRPPGLLNHQCVSLVICSVVPVPVAGWRLFRSLSAGQGNHTCALTLGGSIYCWGAGGMGQRGDRRLSNEWAPVRVRLSQ